MSILNEHQAAESRSSVLADNPYSYAERDLVRQTNRWYDALPAGLFRYRVLKRVIDVGLVLLALPVLIPLLALISMLVKWTSPGPVFFSHRRIRKSGAFFSMWKFRTMCVNSTEVLDDYLRLHPEARAEWYASRKLRVDPRVTPIGSFLRRFSLDELPQVWNVLAGTMSLVGPRPIVASEVEKYSDYFQFYCRVKPGLTGLWQVSGRSELTYEARVQLDCEYVRRWSLTRDFIILTRTFVAVLRQNGAF
jgi:lipopolysaccharide/colanic/teichoic acid biosynthesis glycosyltransferase